MSGVWRLFHTTLHLLALAFCLYFVQGCLRDLLARGSAPSSTEKIADVVMLVAGSGGIAAAGLLIAGVRAPRARRTASILEPVAVVIVVATCLWEFNDFFSNFGHFG